MKKTPVQIVDHPGSGKTTLLVEIINKLTKKGLIVGTIKYSAHPHELDKSGKLKKFVFSPLTCTKVQGLYFLHGGKNE